MAGKKKAPAMGGVEVAPLQPEIVAATAAETSAATLADFSWAVNPLKLNRAKAFVQAQNLGLKGGAFGKAVKDRYIALGGLLTENIPVPNRGKRGGKVQNMAEDDGSKD